MIRYGNLVPTVVGWPNLWSAARNSRRSKLRRPVVGRFEFVREWELARIQRDLEASTYRPGPFRTHRIAHPKPRLISAAPYRDRVVHHAIINVLIPILDRHFHPNSYACRANKGTHAASRKLQEIDPAMSFALRRRRSVISSRASTTRFSRPSSADSSRTTGSSIFSTSSWMGRIRKIRFWNGFPATIYSARLNAAADYYRSGTSPVGVVRELVSQRLRSHHHEPPGIRCLRPLLRRFRRATPRPRPTGGTPLPDRGTACRASLRLHPGKTAIVPTGSGVTFVGYRTWPHRREVRGSNVRLFLKRLRGMRKAFDKDLIDLDEVRQRVGGWVGHAVQADSLHLIARLRASGHSPNLLTNVRLKNGCALRPRFARDAEAIKDRKQKE